MNVSIHGDGPNRFVELQKSKSAIEQDLEDHLIYTGNLDRIIFPKV